MACLLIPSHGELGLQHVDLGGGDARIQMHILKIQFCIGKDNLLRKSQHCCRGSECPAFHSPCELEDLQGANGTVARRTTGGGVAEVWEHAAEGQGAA